MQFLFGRGHGVSQPLGGVGVNQYVASHAACGANKRDVSDALAHHPLEIVPQETINGENVIGTLVVGDKHITCLVVNELSSHNLNPHQMYPAPDARPPLGREVTPIILFE